MYRYSRGLARLGRKVVAIDVVSQSWGGKLSLLTWSRKAAEESCRYLLVLARLGRKVVAIDVVLVEYFPFLGTARIPLWVQCSRVSLQGISF